MLAQFPAYAKDYLGGDASVVTLLLAVFSVGIGAGSLLTERLSGHKVEIGLVPFGSIGLTAFALDLFFASPGHASAPAVSAGAFLRQDGSLRVLLDLFLMGTFGGFYVVPLYALIQSRTEPTHTSRVIAANNILNALFMVLAALLGALLLARGLSVPQLFLIGAILNAAVALYIYRMVPEFLMRFIVWLLIHSVYRLRARGLDNIPDTGAAVLACNHVSYVDALVIAAECRRPIRFIMDHKIFKIPVLSFVFRQSRAIPIAPASEDPERLNRAYDEVQSALRDGDLIGIFPEGKLTPDGELQPFKSGIKRIVDATPVPVVPLALRGLWGSLFSRSRGRAFMKKPRGPFSRIELAAGKPIPADEVTPEAIQAVVGALRGPWRWFDSISTRNPPWKNDSGPLLYWGFTPACALIHDHLGRPRGNRIHLAATAARRSLSGGMAQRLSMEQGYRVQLGILERLIATGERQAGWKVGLTAAAMRAQHGVHEPCFGFLLASGNKPSGHVFRHADLIKPGFENELCLTLGTTLRGPGIVFEQARAAIADVAPALEIVEKRGDFSSGPAPDDGR